jgi:hypothetical protein
MKKQAVHTVVGKQFNAVAACLSTTLIQSSLLANKHLGGRPPPSLQAVVGCVRIVVIAVEPSDVESKGQKMKDGVLISAVYGMPVVKAVLGADRNGLLVPLGVAVGSMNNKRAVQTAPGLGYAAAERVLVRDARNEVTEVLDVMQPLVFGEECGDIQHPALAGCYFEANKSVPKAHANAAEAVKHFSDPFQRFSRTMMSTNTRYRMKVKISRIEPAIHTGVTTNYETLRKLKALADFRLNPAPPEEVPHGARAI